MYRAGHDRRRLEAETGRKPVRAMNRLRTVPPIQKLCCLLFECAALLRAAFVKLESGAVRGSLSSFRNLSADGQRAFPIIPMPDHCRYIARFRPGVRVGRGVLFTGRRFDFHARVPCFGVPLPPGGRPGLMFSIGKALCGKADKYICNAWH